MAEDHGPYETAEQVRLLPSVQRAYGIMRNSPRSEPGIEAAARIIFGACERAGVKLGARDGRVITWLAGSEPEMCAVIAGLITRAAKHDLEESEWGVRRPTADGETVVVNCGTGAENMARDLLADHRRVYGERAALVSRGIGPWTEVAEGGAGD